MPVPDPAPRPHPGCPLVVAYGLGVDSTAMLVEFVRRGVRPDLVLFADTGGEKPETYAYLPVVQAYLKRAGFPPVVTVRYEPKTAPYRTLEGQCRHTGTLPSLAYGGKSCSIKWKRTPQDKYILHRFPPGEHVGRGRRVVRAIGFDAGEGRRTYAGVVKAVGLDAGEGHRLTWARPKSGEPERKPSRETWLDEHYFAYWYPLADWGLDRTACERVIRGAGLPVPVKSACFFCPASKKAEVVWLGRRHPRLLARALAIEATARPNLTSVKGLGRSFAWADFVAAVDRPPLFPDRP
jgi:hypothetical protein